MKLACILQVASAAYPEILQAWDEAAERPADLPGVNHLARCVVSELASTYDASASDKMQLKTAADTLGKFIGAMQDLDRACWLLSEAWVSAVLLERENREDPE